MLAGQSLANLFRHPVYFADMVQQADLIGVGSLPIVMLTGFFTGAVLALNSASTLQRFGSLSLIGQLVSVGMVTELGPVITGLMVAGRNASGMASELGSMVVTEQIDAMRALGTDPTEKAGDAASGVNGVHAFFPDHHLRPAGLVWREHGFHSAAGSGLRTSTGASAWQIAGFCGMFSLGLFKPLLFGFIIATVGCYYGMSARGGTQGVGRATTQAVVRRIGVDSGGGFFVTKLLMALLGYR